jgi:hypothetical protein
VIVRRVEAALAIDVDPALRLRCHGGKIKAR